MNVVTDDQYKTPALGLNYFHSWAYIIHNHRQHLRNVQHMQIMDRMTDTVTFVTVSLKSHKHTHLLTALCPGLPG